MKTSLEQFALKLFEQVCHTQGMDNNILFSPYSLQQALSLLFVNTEDEHIQKEVASYVSPDMLDESLRNTKSGTLMLLKDRYKSFRTYKEKGTIDFFSSPEDGAQKIADFQMQHLGEILFYAKPAKDDNLGLYSALYYSAEWEKAFNKYNTMPRPFYLDDGKEIQPETMKSEFSGVYGCVTADYEVAALPGKNHSIAYFVKPKKRKGIQRLWHICSLITSHKTKEEVLRHLWDICNHDDELHHEVLFSMPKVSMKATVSSKLVLESLNMPWLTKKSFTLDTIVDHSDPRLLPAELNDIQQSVRLCLDETTMKVKAYTESELCLPVLMKVPDPEPPKPLIITMDSPYFIVIKDKTPDGTTRIVCTAWISDPR